MVINIKGTVVEDSTQIGSSGSNHFVCEKESVRA